MEINFTGHQIDVTDALREFTTTKLAKLTRHFDKVGHVNVVFRIEKLDHIAEATIHVAKHELHAHATSDDLYKAIDEMIDKLDRQVVKYKEKLTDHRE